MQFLDCGLEKYAFCGFENMQGYLSLHIICSSKLTVFLEVRSPTTVRFSEQIMSADKYPCIFSHEIGAIVYVSNGTVIIV